ncbi:hypothetical protein RFI_32116 [Reticulomyxa filosa]|uniref:Uncharacterized protein n=1 Tax=Reticulomyxa filosa TaxID=46433 RepID=X6LX15_RETFI|nr:hypothetical protein RFI_32116 [Reticulomyxa filosa]|eukprot:ETO05280.1 hypothetical protein RFI_32116 [Reticulomyxa filosa]
MFAPLTQCAKKKKYRKMESRVLSSKIKSQDKQYLKVFFLDGKKCWGKKKGCEKGWEKKVDKILKKFLFKKNGKKYIKFYLRKMEKNIKFYLRKMKKNDKN